jgi:hypothetical protein
VVWAVGLLAEGTVFRAVGNSVVGRGPQYEGLKTWSVKRQLTKEGTEVSDVSCDADRVRFWEAMV